MSDPERAVDTWYMRWIVHACVLAVLLMGAVAVGVDAHLDEWPPDRAVTKTPVRLSGTKLEPVPTPAARTSTPPSAPVSGN